MKEQSPVIGITGTIGSGKSLVGKFFEELGAHVIDTDVLARQALERGSQGLNSVVKRFGPEIINESGDLKRKVLGSLVFNDAKARQDLEAIVHPIVRALLVERIKTLSKMKPVPIFVLVPLLFESKVTLDLMDMTLCVTVGRDIAERRVMMRDNISQKDARIRLEAQLSSEEKAILADREISNNGTKEELQQKVNAFYLELFR